jgi:hypothetical protein
VTTEELRALIAMLERQRAAAGYVPLELSPPAGNQPAAAFAPGGVYGPRAPNWEGVRPPPVDLLEARERQREFDKEALQFLWEATPPGSFLSMLDAAERGDKLGMVLGALGSVPSLGAVKVGAELLGKVARVAGSNASRAFQWTPHGGYPTRLPPGGRQ